MQSFKHTDHNTGKVKVIKEKKKYVPYKDAAKRAARARQTARLVKMF